MKNLFTISEFARLRNININSLRYYEKIGILKPVKVDSRTGYRYYSPEQLPILDVIRLCHDFGMPLKQLKTYIDDGNLINNTALFETGRRIAEERLQNAQTELHKIEYTIQYLAVNSRYSEQCGIYAREIPERHVITSEYDGELADVKGLETASAVLYEYAQGKQLVPVFPSGLILEYNGTGFKTKVFFEVMSSKSDSSVEILAAGSFLCRQVDLAAGVSLPETIVETYGDCDGAKLIVSNMLLDKYQVGTKKSELQKML